MATQVPQRHSKFQEWESNAVQTKQGGGFTTAMSRTAKALKAGTYKIGVSMEIRMVTPGANTMVKSQFSINSNLKNSFCSQVQGDEWTTVSAWDFQAYGDAATPTFLIEYRRLNAGGDVEIRKMKISIERKKG